MKARIFEIKRFAVHDGDGIRTTVFFKGCPLRCRWCHNPEGISAKPELAFYEHKCIGCGECVSVCPSSAHRIEDGKHVFDRSLCVGCGKCAELCIGEALTLYGKEMSVDEVLSVLLEDREFYENSGGGVTLSGGECLIYDDFCRELLKRLKEEGIHTAADTCGFVSRVALDKVIPYTDIFLYDVKAYDRDVHISCTSKSNNNILENLKYLEAHGKSVEIRIPYVPEYNDTEIEAIAHFLKDFRKISKIRVLPYHSYAASKYKALDIKNTLPGRMPGESEIKRAVDLMSEITKLQVLN